MKLKSYKIANLYDLLFGEQTQDLEFYKYFIEKQKGPALEIGSGSGRLLIPYLQAGLNVEGIEPDPDMQNICLDNAKNLNLKPIIYQLNLQELKLTKKFKTIYMPLYVFQNINNKQSAIESLKKCHEHLEINGQILISIFIPWNDPTGTYEETWRIRKSNISQNQKIILSESVHYDKFEQIQTKHLKYEVFNENRLVESYFEIIKFTCYSIFELTLILEQAGFKNIEVFGDYIQDAANGSSEAFIFHAKK